MLVTQAYRFALDPTPQQARAMASHCGAARFAFNWGLSLVKQRLDERTASPLASITVPWTLSALRLEWNRTKDSVAPWWAENSKEAYNSGLDSLARALCNFAESKSGRRTGRRVGFPRFKRRGRHDACRFTTGAIRVLADRHHVQLPRLGVIKTHEMTRKLARHLERGSGRIMAATITRVADRWFVSFTCQIDRTVVTSNGNTRVVGVDVGIHHLAVLSTGQTVTNPRPLERLQPKRRRLQRRWNRQDICRKKEGRRRWSHRQRETSRQIARLEARAANIRRHELHTLTTRLVREHGTIVVEQLNVAGMLANRRIARVMADAGFGAIRRLLNYKSNWYGAKLLVADPFYPSTKTCSACGFVRTKLPLAERTLRCLICGLVIDRDLNAARNLARLVEHVAGSGPETRNARGADVSPDRLGPTAGKREAGAGRRPSKTGTVNAQAVTTRIAHTC
jgi:IS605 OrfB family transposase